MSKSLSIVIPSKNEEKGLTVLLPKLQTQYPAAEIIIVNDGSSDNTENICRNHNVKVSSHPYAMGNGAAIKTGARAATGDILVFMDADGQHDPADIPRLLAKIDEGYDMAVGARTKDSHAGLHRATANGVYNTLASLMTGHRIPDLTSGFRAVKTKHFRQFLYLLPNGFSYPTTITMSFFRAGLKIAYIPISARKRIGMSHVRLFRDGIRFLLIIFKVGTLYSPLKLFLPVSLFFFCIGTGYYAYTFISAGRFTNMSALMFITSVLVFLIGLVSEQITVLIYKGSDQG